MDAMLPVTKKVDLTEVARDLRNHAATLSAMIDGGISYGRADKRLVDAEKSLRAAIDSLHFAKLEGLS